MRHADATSQDHDAELTEDGIKMLNSEETREKIVRLNPDIIIHTPLLRSKQTAEILRNILKETT
ncbi:histidine phosphatase family protein [bacterium]|nr:histidine phosphatase family protein [bacterium]MBR4567071.1 histidine phosphatase family protein [bacterium]